MGRYAQARRRGGVAGAAPALTPPPAPGIGIVGGDVIQTALGGDDTGGLVKLYTSGDGEEPWTFYTQAAWEAVHNWGSELLLPPGWVRVTEAGNGSAYDGESLPSTAIEVPS